MLNAFPENETGGNPSVLGLSISSIGFWFQLKPAKEFRQEDASLILAQFAFQLFGKLFESEKINTTKNVETASTICVSFNSCHENCLTVENDDKCECLLRTG